MKLLHIVPYANYGGTEKDCFFFARDAREHEHHIWVLGTEGPMSKSWTQVTPFVEHLNLLKERPHKFARNIRDKLVGLSFDGILYWSTLRLPFVMFAVKGHARKMAVHVGNPVKRSLKVGLKNIISSLIWPSDVEIKLFACSEYVESTIRSDYYLEKFKRGVSLNPVELPGENPYGTQEFGTSDEIKLGMVARLYPIKDHETVIKAFHIIIKRYPNARLQFLGDGILKEKLCGLAEELGLQGRIDFLGSSENVYGFLNQLDIFLYGTTPGEGLGNAVSEAMANGLPCVVSDLPMLKEIAGNAGSVFFCKPFDPEDMSEKVLELLRNGEKRRCLSLSAFKRASQAFSTKRYIDERMSFLRD